MPTKATIKITIPVEIEIADLLQEDEFKFVSKCMSDPRSVNEDEPLEPQRKWFLEMWRAQVKLQQALLADPTLLTRFLGAITLDEILHGTPFGEKSIVKAETVKDAIRPAVEKIEAVAHFYPVVDEALLDTEDMIRELSEAVKARFGKPQIALVSTPTPDTSS
jgi:hypothetical protein